MLKESIIKEIKSRGDNTLALCKRLSLNYGTVFNWLKGKKDSISIPVLEKILKEYDLIIVKRY